jgi:hypothetical protein
VVELSETAAAVEVVASRVVAKRLSQATAAPMGPLPATPRVEKRKGSECQC